MEEKLYILNNEMEIKNKPNQKPQAKNISFLESNKDLIINLNLTTNHQKKKKSTDKALIKALFANNITHT